MCNMKKFLKIVSRIYISNKMSQKNRQPGTDKAEWGWERDENKEKNED